MELFRQNRRLISWLACMAILLNALAPAISHAMASTQNESVLWAEICSVAGNKFVPVDFGQPASNQPADSKNRGDTQPMSSMQHCPYCLPHAGSVGVITGFSFELTQIDLSYSLPELFYQSPRTLFVWAASSPRAPPFFS